ncbi:DNA topoisomerase I [Candidatus Uhrbacteria bacterium RIFCSPHIGHO2_12_FULL_54_23]|uniref:DNA topoisomerase 1 n=1 Tax=Candidatus Uhrbacteria bacterium RIFCSPHIGHO2_12_FULL_54_23 TaxID=1802397 RepID=A0A1F7UI75_9BACT|nr:MAG: DNA topoisomerase I [Candidatus Uhrbacteria bacterium RIFCSPHIGHO2_12_FULL_54_23]
MNLVIVESPAKAKTISKFLGRGFKVESSFGHIRDLPKSTMGVDPDKDFAPDYVIPKDKSKHVAALKKLARKADTVYLATDEDREGEAISWHLAVALDIPADRYKRISFHEITKEAIMHAVEHPRALDFHRVDAQQARRILDRLVGYELSPLLWKKVARGLSAGRVQSVAVRLIVEREREIEAHKPQEYWTIEASLETKDKETFQAKLQAIAGKPVEKFDIANEARAKELLAALDGKEWKIAQVSSKKTSRKPSPPFTTSTLQQEANRKLGFSAKQTMMFAQQLYEGVELGGEGSVGLITYMRTDSVNLAEKFLTEAQSYLASMGSEYAAAAPRRYTTKTKGAQEAHEAVRPTDIARTPEHIRAHLAPEQLKLYDLIWRRALASQMPDAVLNQVIIDTATDEHNFRASGSTIAFDGFLKLYPDGATETFLPAVKEGDAVNPKEVKPLQHFTEPKARYSEASLVKALEELGIGRPSTYAPTISTVIERGYVLKEEKRLKPTDMAFVVNDLLVAHFPSIVDYQFTAKMEEEFDDIAQGARPWVPVIKAFYDPFKKTLTEKEQTLSKKEITTEETKEVCEKCGKPMLIKLGRFGKFLACSGYPDCKNTKPLPGATNGRSKEENERTAKLVEELKEKYKGEVCEKCGSPMAVKVGRFGPFLSCSDYPTCKTIKNIEQSTGVRCPLCGKGDIVVRRSKRGKPFFACNQYPECKNAYWSRPTGETCPECKALLVYAAKDTVRCSSKECKYKKPNDGSAS